MMSGLTPTPNFDDLYKFLASLGLAFLVTACAVPWLVQQGSSDLLLSREEIESLTSTAQQVVERRQGWLEVAAPLSLWFSGALIVVGLIAIIKGLKGWRSRQKEIDERLSLVLERERDENRKLTPKQAEEKLEAEVAEVVEADGASAISRAHRDDIRDRYRGAEQSVVGALAAVTPVSHRLLPNVRIDGRHERIGVDALLKDEHSGGNDVIVEVKLASTPHMVRRNLLAFGAQIAARRSARPITLLVVVVVDERWPQNRTPAFVSEMQSEFAALGLRARVDVVEENMLPRYRPDLSDLI